MTRSEAGRIGGRRVKARHRFTRDESRAGGVASAESRRCVRCRRVRTARELAEGHVCP